MPDGSVGHEEAYSRDMQDGSVRDVVMRKHIRSRDMPDSSVRLMRKYIARICRYTGWLCLGHPWLCGGRIYMYRTRNRLAITKVVRIDHTFHI